MIKKMKILLSSHVKLRFKERRISPSYPEKVISSPDKIYVDNVTGYQIAIKKLLYNKRIRPMVVVYDIIGEEIHVITIYPATDSEITNKVKKRRWLAYEKN